MVAFGIDDQVPLPIFWDDQPNRRFARNATGIFEIESFCKSLIVHRIHEANIVYRTQCHLDRGARALWFEIVMGETEIWSRHVSLFATPSRFAQL